MAQSLSKIYIHTVFSTKYRAPLIKQEIEKELFAYIGDTINRDSGIPFLINGTEDHIHILSTLPRTITLAKYIENIKRNSSRWIKEKGSDYLNFAWQNGYASFSVSSSKIDVVKNYISNQKEHHKKIGFKEELISFLEKYLWD